ncbi:MAG TPA: AMP-binding protein [Deltaproteobacteria bacterium]|nr:AMP-binding protein [Deltaproteobacteria bacterium]
MNLYSWLQGHAKERPGKVAIRFRDQEITFRELYRLTDALGTALRGAGVNRDDHVTLMLPNVPEFVLTYMATIGIGAVVTPINPSYTSRELKHILGDSDSRVLVIEQSNRDTYDDIAAECPQKAVITTGPGGSFPEWVTGSGSGIVEDRGRDDVAVMIYSSGLTGYPMGAMLTQGNLDHNSDLLRLCMEADDTDTTLTLIPCFHSFSASVNMLSMLRYGGTIYLMKKLDFRELRHALTDGGVTAICAVPTLFYGLVHHPDLSDIDYAAVRTLIAGGSALSVEVYDAFKEKFHTDIRQGYGITEASPVCSVNRKNRPIKPTSIGQTVPGVAARVQDDEGNILGPGQTGELLFKGPNIMKGYYRREQETRDIIRDGWLHTGDLGYTDEEGYIFITGYKKDMVITSGFNVYSREVTNVLNSLPGIRDSAIIGEPDLMRGAIIKAFVVSDGAELTEDDVKKFARRQLATFKTPRKVVFVPEIPRDGKGRVLFDLLREAP